MAKNLGKRGGSVFQSWQLTWLLTFFDDRDWELFWNVQEPVKDPRGNAEGLDTVLERFRNGVGPQTTRNRTHPVCRP